MNARFLSRLAAFVAVTLPNAIGGTHPTLEWSIPQSGTTLVVEFDVQGLTIIGGFDGTNSPTWSVKTVDPNGSTVWSHAPSTRGRVNAIAVDLDGRSVAVGMLRPDTRDLPTVVSYSPSGAVQWTAHPPFQNPSQPGPGQAYEVRIDPDGVIYCAGYLAGSDFCMRLSAQTGAIEWIRYFTDSLMVMDVDRRGDVYIARMNGTENIIVQRLSATTGETAWEYQPGAEYDVNNSAVIRCGLDASVIIQARGLNTNRLTCMKIGANGVLRWITTRLGPQEFLNISDGVVARDGTIYGTGGAGTSRIFTWSFAPTGEFRWETSFSGGVGTGGSAISVDRLGNPYVAGSINSGGALIKYDRATGAFAWDPPAATQAPLPTLFAIDVNADNGIVVGSVSGAARYRQQYIDIPEVYRNSADFRIEQASIWHPDFPSFEFERRFGDGDICWNQSNGTDCQYNLSFDDVDEGRSAAGYGGRVQVRTDGRLRFGFRAEATAGSVDIAYPGEAEVVIPGQAKWNRGKPVTIQTSWTPSPTAGLTGRGKPTLNAGLVVSGNVSAFANARAWSPEDSVTLFNLNRSRVLDPATYIVSIFGLGGGAWQNGVWISLCEPTNYVCGNWRIPPLDVNAGLANGQMASHAADRFMEIRGNLTQIMSVNLLGFPTILRYPPAQGGGGGAIDASLDLRLMQAYIQHSFEAVQDITWTPQPQIEFEWSDAGFPAGPFPLGQDINFTVPDGWDGDVNVTPIISVQGQLHNRTGIRFIPNLGFETISLSGNVSVGPVPVFSEELCFGCIESPDPGLPAFPGYNRSYNLPADDEPLERRMPPIQINGQGLDDQWPEVAAASRETLPMILYDQFSPRQSDFNGIVNRNARMLIYGEDFFETHNPVARIEHMGRLENLRTTRLNNNTLLIEIPNRFRLVPGVARLSVQNTVDSQTRDSNKFDLPIEYPIPNLATVNPNLWAADPALKTVPVSVIDGLSSAGNHTFIARRDYYLVLRDQLWNASTAGGLGAAEYFDEFDFNATPGFPSVLFDGVPLSRFEQPVDNGIHNVRLPEAAYSAPRLVNVVLQNPPPGQAASQPLQLTIAAPRPVISGFDPPSVPPGEGFTLIVKGPSNVPFWENYEEPKYGNFTAASFVLWDGVPLATTFIHSGVLHAEVAPELVQQLGYHNITVETPSGGSSYFEQLRNGDGVVVQQGLVPSGCSFNAAGEIQCGSDPMVFRVEYPQPSIEEFMPSTLAACAATGPDELFIEMAITGSGFAPDCRLFMDGTARPVVRVSAEMLQFTVTSAEIATPGVIPVFVENPGPYGGVSNVMTLEIVLTDCNGNSVADECEINAGSIADCNANRVPDSCDIAGGASADGNGNGIPDECEVGNTCPGDADGDRDVDISDLTQLLANFGTLAGAGTADGDNDADGDVDLGDLTALLAHFGIACR